MQTLVKLFHESSDAHLKGNILDNLQQIAPEYPLILSHKIDLKSFPPKPKNPQQKTSQELALATETLMKKLAISTHPDQRIRLISKLATYDPHHPEILPNLLNALGNTSRKASMKLVTETLSLLMEDRLPIIFPKVRDIYLNPSTHSPSTRACYKLLWDWSKNLTYTDFQHLWHSVD